jgi:hypothetical protein
MADLDMARQYFLEQGLNGAIPIGPICADEVNACCRDYDNSDNRTQCPEPHFASPEFRFLARRRSNGCHSRRWRACHLIEFDADQTFVIMHRPDYSLSWFLKLA